MNVFVLRNERTGAAIGAVSKAASPLERIVGLLRTSHVPRGEGLWIEPCSSVHTVGMRTAIDILFLDRDGRVLRTYERVPPNRLAVVCSRAHVTVELGAGTIAHAGVAIGDRLWLATAAVPA